MKRTSIILAALALLCLPSCASKKTPMVKTTTYGASDLGQFGAAPVTVTEAPFESELDKGFGKATDNLFAQ